MINRASTQGNSIAGAQAGVLGASQVFKLARGELAAVGHELLLDLGDYTIESTRLVANPQCRASHQRWQLEPIDDVPLELIARDLRAESGFETEAEIAFPDHIFLARADCLTCGASERWRVALAHDPRLEPCARCDAPRRVSGFAQRERVRLDALPPELLERTPRELGLRAGDVIELHSGGRGRVVRYELAPGGERVVSDATVHGITSASLFGLGNTGSALAPHLARVPGLERVLVCDPDRYERGQQRTQAITAADVGRPKVEVASETLCRIAPALDVRSFALPLEAVPLGYLRNSVVISCLDSVGARMRLAERAWRVGSLFIDTGVAGGASLAARVTVFAAGTGADDVCFECSLEDYSGVESTWPCDAVPVVPVVPAA